MSDRADRQTCPHPEKCCVEGCHGCEESVTRRMAGGADRQTAPEIAVYAQDIVDAPDEWTPHYTRSELLPMAKAYLERDVLAARLVHVEAALEAAERLVAVSSWDSIEQAEDLRVALAVLRVGRNDE